VEYLLRRVATSLIVIWGVTLVTFMLLHVTAGDYIPGIDPGANLRPEDLARLRVSLGLDRPLYVQYLTWMWALLHGDLGRSMLDGIPVMQHVRERLPNTFELALAAMLMGLAFAIPLGTLSALRRGTWVDHVVTVFSVSGFAVPQFWLALMMIVIFSVSFRSWGLPYLPSAGAANPLAHGDLLDRLDHLVMPATVLGLLYISVWSRYMRSSMLSVLSQDYIRTARSKGMSGSRVVYAHAFRNAALPLVTLVGLELPRLVSGALVVEVVFNWPGIGNFAFQRALAYDFTAVLGVTTIVAVLVVAGNLAADLVYTLLDPRVKLA